MSESRWWERWFGRAREASDQVARDAAARAVGEAVEKAGDAILDDLESALLGHKGAADDVLRKDDGSNDPLEAARRAYGLDPGSAPPSPSPDDREARARAELAELKRKMGKS